MSSITPRRAAIAVALVLLATLPIWVGNTYYINIASQILLWAILALALNVLVGYAGLTSLGHAGLFAMAGYTAAMLLDAGYNHFTADIVAIAVTLATTAVFAVLALRATGIGFLMITLAIGQILWGIAYRWVEPHQRRQRHHRVDPAGAVRHLAHRRQLLLPTPRSSCS